MLRRTGPKQYEPSEHPLTVLGSEAKVEGTFEIADSIQIECEVGGRLKVGGRLVIGERGFVRADVEAVDVIIYGKYDGNMVATGSVEVAPSGRVVGNIETNSLVISRGGFFNGTTIKLKESEADAGPCPADRPRRGEVAAEASGRKVSILRETDLDQAIDEHKLASLEDEAVPSGHADDPGDSEPEDPLAGPPKRRARTRSLPRSERRKKTKIGDYYHASVAKLKETEREPVPDVLIEDIDEFLPSLLSQGPLLPTDPDPNEGPPVEDRSRRKGRRSQAKQGTGSARRGADAGHDEEDHGLSLDGGGASIRQANGEGDSEPEDPLAGPPKRRGRARAVPRAGRRKKTKTSDDHDSPVKLNEAKAEEGRLPAFLVHDIDDTLPPLPTRAELLPADLEPDKGPDTEGRPGWDEPGDGMNQRSDSAFHSDDESDDDRGTSGISWARPPAPFPDDDPLGIR